MADVTPARFEIGAPMLLAGLRRRHPFAEAESGLPRQWRDFHEMAEAPGRIGSTWYGVMCGADAEGFEYMTAVEVESFADVPGLGRMRVPPQHYAVFAPAEGVSLRTTWAGILAWLEIGPYASAHLPDFERYTSPPDPALLPGAVEIWVGVVPR